MLVDGLPLGYLLPVESVPYLMESMEDRNRDFIAASALRIAFAALAVSLLLPVYIAVATYHQAVIPMPILRSLIEK